jgi:RNA polymerase sigma-B factor
MARSTNRPMIGRRALAGTEAHRRAEDRTIYEYAARRDPASLERSFIQFQPLARSLAARYRNRTEPFEDLLQVANLGLIKAIKGFDPDNGTRFSSYAVPTILGELRRHFRDRVWSVRVPRRLQESWLEMDAIEADLTSRLGREPKSQELCAELGWSEETLAETVTADRARMVSSLDQPCRGEDEAQDGHALVGRSDPGYEAVEAEIAAEAAELTDRERAVLRMQFEEGMSQREIGARIGVSQMQVSRISRKALKRLLAAIRGTGGGGGRIAAGHA